MRLPSEILAPMPDSPQKKVVPAELAGQRLDQALARMFPEYSRSRLKNWLVAGQVTVDELVPRPRDPVQGGELVVVVPRLARETASVPQPVDFAVAWEDDDLLIVDKPAGLVVHPGAGNLHGTLQNGLLHRVPNLANLPRAGIVHRLDKDTSGLLLVARTLAAHTALVRALAERRISRHYLAVCVGVPTGGATIDAPLARHAVDRLRMAVRDDGKPAVTRFTVRERFRAHAALDVRLDTGRTHQIRVHLAHRQYPIVGDPVYGGRLRLPPGATGELVACLKAFRRQALHAVRLEFEHPVTGAPIDVASPPAPDIEELLAVLRRDLGAAA